MNNKDLFDAIHNANQNSIASAWENTDAEHPIVLRPEKRSAKKTVRNIALAAGGTAAAAAVCFAVVSAVNGSWKNNPFLPSSSTSGSSDPAAVITAANAAQYDNRTPSIAELEKRIIRYGNVGYFRDKYDKTVYENLEWIYSPEGEDFLRRKDIAIDIEIPEPDVFYFNDFPIEAEKLTYITKNSLYHSTNLSGQEKEDDLTETDFLMAEPWFRVRYGDVGFFVENRTEKELMQIKEYCANPGLPVRYPPADPDIYYFHDRPYTKNVLKSYNQDDADWLNWYCWLSEEEQAEMSGFVPMALVFSPEDGHTFPEISELPETVTYKGHEIKVDDLEKLDTAFYLVWYDSLPAELKSKVGYEPSELREKNQEDIPYAELPINIVGPDGVKLTYKELENAVIYKYEQGVKDGENANALTEISADEIEQWDRIVFKGFVYLAEPGADEFKRYNIGDTVCGAKIQDAMVIFERSDDDQANPALQYVWGDVAFGGGSIVTDVMVIDDPEYKKHSGSHYYRFAFSGLPVIDLDEEARKEGRIVPKKHTADEYLDDPSSLLGDISGKYWGVIFGDSELLSENQGTVIHDVNLIPLNFFWQVSNSSNPRANYVVRFVD